MSDSANTSASSSKDTQPSSEPQYNAAKTRAYLDKSESKYIDPCQEQADRSLKCLRRNGGDRTMCNDFFGAYKECKQQWMDAMREAKRVARAEKGWFGWT